MMELQTLLEQRRISFSKDENRLYCISHIVNVSSQHIGKLIEAERVPTARFMPSEDSNSSGSDDEENSKDTRSVTGLISKVRQGVQAV